MCFGHPGVGKKNIFENNYLKMKLLINFMVVGYQEDVTCHLESAGRAVNSSGSQQMVTKKEMDKKK